MNLSLDSEQLSYVNEELQNIFIRSEVAFQLWRAASLCSQLRKNFKVLLKFRPVFISVSFEAHVIDKELTSRS